jgi:hypothetical protein
MSDGAGNLSTSGYGLYLQGQNSTSLCQGNDFLSLDIENNPLKAVRLEDYSNFNRIHIAFDQLSPGGFDFSLKKNLTANTPVSNMLVFSTNAGNCKVESDSFQNTLFTSVPLAPTTGAYPAGISGFGPAVFSGAQFSTMYGGGSGHDFVGAATNNQLGSTTAPATVASFALPTNAAVQNMEVGAEMKVTAYTSGTIQIQVTYNDRDGAAQTAMLPLFADNATLSTGAAATGNFRSPTVPVLVNTATVTIATIGTFTATYKASGFLRATA